MKSSLVEPGSGSDQRADSLMRGDAQAIQAGRSRCAVFDPLESSAEGVPVLGLDYPSNIKTIHIAVVF